MFRFRSERPSNFIVRRLLKAFCQLVTAKTRSARSVIDSIKYKHKRDTHYLPGESASSSSGMNSPSILLPLVEARELCLKPRGVLRVSTRSPSVNVPGGGDGQLAFLPTSEIPYDITTKGLNRTSSVETRQ